MDSQYIVICLTDKDDRHGQIYIQATRRRFASFGKAKLYAKGIPECRDPRVVEVRESYEESERIRETP